MLKSSIHGRCSLDMGAKNPQMWIVRSESFRLCLCQEEDPSRLGCFEALSDGHSRDPVDTQQAPIKTPRRAYQLASFMKHLSPFVQPATSTSHALIGGGDRCLVNA